MLSRRSLITSFAALLAAPAIVRASSLMPVKEPLLRVVPLDTGWNGLVAFEEKMEEIWWQGRMYLPTATTTSTATEVAMRIDDYMRSLRLP